MLLRHIYGHKGIKKHICPHEWCDFAFAEKDGLQRHMETHTTREGYINNLTEESRLMREMKKWGLDIDTNITINASRNGCLTDTERIYSRVDMVVLNVTPCMIECLG